MIIAGDPGTASGAAGFPDPPTGSPGGVAAIARSLSSAAEDFDRVHGRLNVASSTLAEDWQGYAAAAYHACSDGLASVARGGAESFRDCADALTGYSRALDHAQSEIHRLRGLYDAAMAAEASAAGAVSGLQNKLGAATKQSDITKLSDKISSDQTAVQNAGFSASGYARQATAVLEEFRQAESRYAQVLDGARLTPNGGPAPGSPFEPFEPAGAPGPGFGVPATVGSVVPGLLAGAFGGVIPVGNPWAPGGIPGYGTYLDGREGNLTSPSDLTNLIMAIASFGGAGAVRDLGEGGLRWLAETLGLGGAGREAVEEAEQKAVAKALEEATESGLKKAATRRAMAAAGEKAGLAKAVAQQESRATVAEGILHAAGNQGLLPPGVADVVSEALHRGGVYTTYAIAKLLTLQKALVSSGNPAAFAAARVVARILSLVSR